MNMDTTKNANYPITSNIINSANYPITYNIINSANYVPINFYEYEHHKECQLQGCINL